MDSSGLINITGLRDWARIGGGGHNSEGNALLYKVLTNSADLALAVSSPTLSASYAANATTLKSVFNTVFWDANAGLYRDNTTTDLHPQDANSVRSYLNLLDDTFPLTFIGGASPFSKS